MKQMHFPITEQVIRHLFYRRIRE